MALRPTLNTDHHTPTASAEPAVDVPQSASPAATPPQAIHGVWRPGRERVRSDTRPRRRPLTAGVDQPQAAASDSGAALVGVGVAASEAALREAALEAVVGTVVGAAVGTGAAAGGVAVIASCTTWRM